MIPKNKSHGSASKEPHSNSTKLINLSSLPSSISNSLNMNSPKYINLISRVANDSNKLYINKPKIDFNISTTKHNKTSSLASSSTLPSSIRGAAPNSPINNNNNNNHKIKKPIGNNRDIREKARLRGISLEQGQDKIHQENSYQHEGYREESRSRAKKLEINTDIMSSYHNLTQVTNYKQIESVRSKIAVKIRDKINKNNDQCTSIDLISKFNNTKQINNITSISTNHTENLIIDINNGLNIENLDDTQNLNSTLRKNPIRNLNKFFEEANESNSANKIKNKESYIQSNILSSSSSTQMKDNDITKNKVGLTSEKKMDNYGLDLVSKGKIIIKKNPSELKNSIQNKFGSTSFRKFTQTKSVKHFGTEEDIIDIDNKEYKHNTNTDGSKKSENANLNNLISRVNKGESIVSMNNNNTESVSSKDVYTDIDSEIKNKDKALEDKNKKPNETGNVLAKKHISRSATNNTSQKFVFNDDSNNNNNNNNNDNAKNSNKNINIDNKSAVVNTKTHQNENDYNPRTYYIVSMEKYHQNPDQNDYFCKLYKEHFIQTYQAIQFCKTLKQVDPKVLSKKKIALTKRDTHKDKKTVIFDLDETLIHCNESLEVPYDVKLPIKFPNGETIEAGINIRPFAMECLKELNQYYEIIVFTASHSCYANTVLDHLDPKQLYIHHRLFREHCIQTEEGVYIKDLRILSNRNLDDVLLVDNAAYSFGYQLENGIPIIPYYDNKDDQELKTLIPYLKYLNGIKYLKEVNKAIFRFHIYTIYNSPEKVLDRLLLSTKNKT